jgi:hypothetical protein
MAERDRQGVPDPNRQQHHDGLQRIVFALDTIRTVVTIGNTAYSCKDFTLTVGPVEERP